MSEQIERKIWSGWKTVAIIFIVLFTIQTAIFVWGYMETKREAKLTNICYYNICEDYPEAIYEYDQGLCTCYDYDLMGNPTIAKTKILN